MHHTRPLRGLVMAGAMALVATTLSATAAVPATALAPSPKAAECADGHGHADEHATARVRKGAKANEPKPFTGTGEQYFVLDDASTLAAASVTIPTYVHVVLPASEATNGTAARSASSTRRTPAARARRRPQRRPSISRSRGSTSPTTTRGTAWCRARSRSR